VHDGKEALAYQDWLLFVSDQQLLCYIITTRWFFIASSLTNVMPSHLRGMSGSVSVLTHNVLV
jgi:hypothetical protein